MFVISASKMAGSDLRRDADVGDIEMGAFDYADVLILGAHRVGKIERRDA